MKDMGTLEFILGLQVERSPASGSIRVHQEAYLTKLLEVMGMTDAKPTTTPLEPKLSLPKQVPNTDTAFRSAVGSLMWAMVGTRPDIAAAVGMVSRHLVGSGPEQWAAVKRILRYLTALRKSGIQYMPSGRKTVILSCYADSDWAASEEDRRSTTGYVLMIAGGAISWNSRKQATVALSSTEAEYMAVSAALQDVIWARDLLA